jgi:SAM-dependent methyltransferase
MITGTLPLARGEGMEQIPGVDPSWFEPFDPAPDAAFYEQPRFVAHIDEGAIARIGQFYAERLPQGGALLDLMSSWISHLPDGFAAQRVAGLGMNAEELARNPRLTEWTVRDLNHDPRLPYPDASFDGAICCVSVQYLRKPVSVFREVARVLRPGAPFLVTFSNRCFPTKAIPLWTESSDARHLNLVAAYFQQSGGWESIERVDSSPGGGDPVYLVSARRCAEA